MGALGGIETQKILAAAMVAALSTPCVAADSASPSIETVVVEASTLAGVWKVPMPQYSAFTLSHMKYGPLHDVFCRIEQPRSDLSIVCLGMGPTPPFGTVSLDGANIHLAWGSMMFRGVFDGTLQSSSQFTGNIALKLFGVRYDDPEQSIAKKLTLSKAAPDRAGKSALLARLLDEMAKGLPLERTAEQSEYVQLFTPEALRPLGAAQTVIYVGEFAKPVGTKSDGSPKDFINFSVYDVEFANGARLCGLHQREDGALDGLICV